MTGFVSPFLRGMRLSNRRNKRFNALKAALEVDMSGLPAAQEARPLATVSLHVLASICFSRDRRVAAAQVTDTTNVLFEFRCPSFRHLNSPLSTMPARSCLNRSFPCSFAVFGSHHECRHIKCIPKASPTKSRHRQRRF